MYQTTFNIGYMVLNWFSIASLQSNVYKGHRPQPNKLFNTEMEAVQCNVCSNAKIQAMITDNKDVPYRTKTR